MSQPAPSQTSWPVLAWAARHDLGAVEALLLRARPLVHAIILDRVRNPEAAEDLTQEALTDLVQGLSELREPGAFLSWVRTIALNRCRMWWRRREQEYVQFDEQTQGKRAPDAYAVTAQRETWRQLRKALDELPERSRLALLMHVLGDCPHAEIAEALGESEVGVRVRVHRARQRLRELLPPSFYDAEEMKR